MTAQNKERALRKTQQTLEKVKKETETVIQAYEASLMKEKRLLAEVCHLLRNSEDSAFFQAQQHHHHQAARKTGQTLIDNLDELNRSEKQLFDKLASLKREQAILINKEEPNGYQNEGRGI